MKKKKPSQKLAEKILIDYLDNLNSRITRLELIYTTLIDPTVIDSEVKKYLRKIAK